MDWDVVIFYSMTDGGIWELWSGYDFAGCLSKIPGIVQWESVSPDGEYEFRIDPRFNHEAIIEQMHDLAKRMKLKLDIR